MTRIRANGLEHLAAPAGGRGGAVRLACDDTLVFPDDRDARPCRVCFPADRPCRAGAVTSAA